RARASGRGQRRRPAAAGAPCNVRAPPRRRTSPLTSATRYYDSSVSPATKERVDRGTGSGIGAPWNVVVLNDNHNTFEGVAFAIASTIPGVSYERGMALATRIHNAGRAIVWSGHKEAAELYWDQLNGHGLTMAPLERT